jgi:hypothetical protein
MNGLPGGLTALRSRNRWEIFATDPRGKDGVHGEPASL